MAKQQNPRITSIEYGKLPPQAPEFEDAVLGALMVEKEAIEKIELQADDFYKLKNQTIFKAIQALREKHEPIDIFTVQNELRRMGELDAVGGQYHITLLSMGANSAANIQYHASIIKQKAVARKLIALSSTVQEMAFSEHTDVADIMEYLEQNYTNISTGATRTEAYDMTESITETLEYIQRIHAEAQNGSPIAIPTGLQSLDKELNGGWRAPDLIILGGRPSMGKTQFAVHFAKHAAISGFPVLFCSIEMTKIQLIIRMITENEAIDYYKLKTGQLNHQEWQELENTIVKISKMDIFIADDYKIKYMANIKSLARKQARAGKLKLMIVDYIGLIKTNERFGTRDLEIGYITGELKSLCKELNVPIIALNQLSRPEKGAKVRKPRLEDLRESGNLEQDADIVIMPHRPDYYDPLAVDGNMISWRNRGELIIAKHREGSRNVEIPFKHDDAFKKIFDDESQNYNFQSRFENDNRTTESTPF
jgi:replicative DNA helicase